MGNFKGHVLPGSFFITFSFWWLLNILNIHFRNSRRKKTFSRENIGSLQPDVFHSTTWMKCPCRKLSSFPLEPFAKATASTTGIIGELTWGNWSLFNSQGGFSNLNNFAHATMFTSFLVVATVEIFRFYRAAKTPSSLEHVLTATAYGVEGLLFYYHLHERNELDQKLHVLLYSVIFATVFVYLLESWQRNSLMLFTVRSFLVMLQGTWFVQVAFVLYGPKPWENIPSNQAFVAIVFTWHVLGLLLLWLLCFGFVAVLLRVRFCMNTKLGFCREQNSCDQYKIIELDSLMSEDSRQDTND